MKATVVKIREMLNRVRNWYRRRAYREGETLSAFIAKDVRRDILIVSTARIDEGVITGHVRTSNLLYVARGLASEAEFGPEEELQIDTLWRWTGRSWGGLPDGTSIVDHASDSQRKAQ